MPMPTPAATRATGLFTEDMLATCRAVLDSLG